MQVVIDVDPRVHVTERRAESGNSLEWSIRVGASLVREFHQHSWTVACTAGMQPIGGGSAGIKPILDGLAVLDPSEARNFGDRLTGVDSRHTMRIVVTTGRRMKELQASNAELARSTRFVVLQSQEQAEYAGAWMHINCEADVPRQLQTQWERLCHDAWSAA